MSTTSFDTINTSALVKNMPIDNSVVFEIDGYPCEVSTEDQPNIFNSKCFNVDVGDHVVEAYIQDISGKVASDINLKIGAQGKYYVAVGDSITNGIADNFSSDNNSQDGRIVSSQGYQATLDDLLSDTFGIPIIVFNEGIGGDESYDAAYERIDSILLRHSNSKFVLVLLGTNDSGGTQPVTSGWLCSDSACAGTFYENMQVLIDKILTYGKQPIVALVPPAFGADNQGTPYSNPMEGLRNVSIQEYNWVIAGHEENPPMLIGHQVGPDLFGYFLGSGVNRFNLFKDNVHLNALGMVVLAHLWHNILAGDNKVPLTLANLIPSNYKQNLLEVGDNYYIDRDYKIDSIPSELIGNDIVWIMTADDDNNNTDADFISFDTDRNVTVYVAYDPRAISPPDWLNNNFISTGLVLDVSDPQTSTLALYESNSFGTVFSLGGNKAAGASYPGGVTAANYIVAVKPF